MRESIKLLDGSAIQMVSVTVTLNPSPAKGRSRDQQPSTLQPWHEWRVVRSNPAGRPVKVWIFETEAAADAAMDRMLAEAELTQAAYPA